MNIKKTKPKPLTTGKEGVQKAQLNSGSQKEEIV